MIEISYWREESIIRGKFMVVAISIPFKWNNILHLSKEDIEEVNTSKIDLGYFLNLVIIEKNFKYLTKGAIILKVKEVLFDKDLFMTFFVAGQISVLHKNDANSIVVDLFTHPKKIKTENISINKKLVHEILSKKIKKS